MAQLQSCTSAIRPSRWGLVLIVIFLASTVVWGQQRADSRIFIPADRAVNGDAYELTSTNRAMALDVDIAAFKAVAAPEMTISNVPLAPGLTVDLELREWNIVKEGANLVYGTEHGEEPITLGVRMYRGTVKGESESDVFLSFADGSLLGHVTTSDKSYEISTDFEVKPDGFRVPATSYPTDALPNSVINCGVNEDNLLDLLGGSLVDYDYEKYAEHLHAPPRTAANSIDYAAEGAWEGDVEYLGLFNGDGQAAADYMAGIIGGVSAVFERDLNVQLTISHMKIWTSPGASGYPYKEAEVMSIALRETMNYWNQEENKKIDHAIAHTFSGKNWKNPIGIAFLDVLCPRRGNSPDAQGAYSAITRKNSARDRSVVTHETGHNFGANHTHYCGWKGEFNGAIDKCAPAEGGTCFSVTEQTVGTIMSYCSHKELKFHPLVINRLKQKIRNEDCLIAAKKLLIQPNLVIFANEIQGVPRDTVLETFFTNVGQYDSIEITGVLRDGAYNDQFEILEGMPPFTLAPNETKRIAVRFKAELTVGAQMHLVYQHNGLNPPIKVTFEGYASDIRPILGLRNDFDEIMWTERFIGTINDTVQEDLYINLGVDGVLSEQTATLYITETWIDGPDKLDFQLLEGSAPIQLDGLEKASAAFRFAPTTPGSKKATFYIRSNSDGVPGTLDSLGLVGNGVTGPIMELALPDLIIDFGDVRKGSPRIDTVFENFFRNSGQVSLVYVTDLQRTKGEENVFTASTISNLLKPGESDRLTFSFFAKPEHQLGLKQAQFIIISDNENQTYEVSNDTLHLVGNVLAPSSVPDNLEPDEFFYVTENPTTGSEVSFFLGPRQGEVGDLFIASLIDMNGREVWRQVGQFQTDQGDTWRLDAREWPSGVYYIRVSTTDEIRARKLTITW